MPQKLITVTLPLFDGSMLSALRPFSSKLCSDALGRRLPTLVPTVGPSGSLVSVVSVDSPFKSSQSLSFLITLN